MTSSTSTSRLLRTAAAWPGETDDPALQVSVIRRNGRMAAVVYRPDLTEAARRCEVGQPPITELWLLDALLNLPLDLPVPLEQLTERERRDLRRLPPCAVDTDGTQVVRRTRPPLTVTFALVSAQRWKTGLAAAGHYAPYCRRAMLLPAAPAEADALLEASLFDVGVGLANGPGVEVLLAPGPYTRLAHNAAQWAFTEQVYAQLPSPQPSTGRRRHRRPG